MPKKSLKNSIKYSLQLFFSLSLNQVIAMNWIRNYIILFSILFPDVFARTFGTCRAFDAKDRLISYAQEAVTCQDTFKARIRIKVFVFESYFHLRSQIVALSYGEFMDGLE